MRLIDIDNITALDIMHNVICDKEVAHKMLDFLQSQPTIQPQGIDKDRLIEELERQMDSLDMTKPHSCSVSEAITGIMAYVHTMPIVDVPDIYIGEIPQSITCNADGVKRVIEILEYCKQRHIDIAIQLPHTVDREKGMVSCYAMALKVVRECLQQPHKE